MKKLVKIKASNIVINPVETVKDFSKKNKMEKVEKAVDVDDRRKGRNVGVEEDEFVMVKMMVDMKNGLLYWKEDVPVDCFNSARGYGIWKSRCSGKQIVTMAGQTPVVRFGSRTIPQSRVKW